MSISPQLTLPFPPAPRARANLKTGVLYAIDGRDSFIYYGQVTPQKRIGFFRFRSQAVQILEALSSDVMCRFGVSHPSIGIALRTGKWVSLGLHPLHAQLADEPAVVQWPVGTLDVTIWKDGEIVGTTRVDDPRIQNLEVIAAYDAVYHAPERLRLDYTGGPEEWSVGGSIRRERLKKQVLAQKFPDAPWHMLPEDWIPVDPEFSGDANADTPSGQMI